MPLLGPVAEKLGIDLIWFGVLLGVNMQTSFMHPPFGFALFYLRSVAPAKEYLDKITGKMTAPVTTGQIYWGAVPFVLIQVIMVGLVIVFPQMVMVYKRRSVDGRSEQDRDRSSRGRSAARRRSAIGAGGRARRDRSRRARTATRRRTCRRCRTRAKAADAGARPTKK